MPPTGHRGRPCLPPGNGYRVTSAPMPQRAARRVWRRPTRCAAPRRRAWDCRVRPRSAWLISDGVVSPASRFANDGPWYRADGVRVADGLSQFASATPFQPLNLTPGNNIGYFATSIGVWTGLNADGSPAAETCAGWTLDDGAAAAPMGCPIAETRTGAALAPPPAAAPRRLYRLADNDTLTPRVSVAGPRPRRLTQPAQRSSRPL